MNGGPILTACEESGAITAALIALGYDAWSNDILPTRGPHPDRHLQMDAREALTLKPWTGLLAHPVCRAMAGSGAKHQYINMRRENPDGTINPFCPKRTKEMEDGAKFFRVFMDSDIPVKGIENSKMLGRAKKMIGCGDQDQVTQPWWFGDELFKGAAWWLYNLPPMEKTSDLMPPPPGTDEHKVWSECWYAAPSDTRERDRAVTPPCTAHQHALQWGPYLSGMRTL